MENPAGSTIVGCESSAKLMLAGGSFGASIYETRLNVPDDDLLLLVLMSMLVDPTTLWKPPPALFNSTIRACSLGR